MLMQYLRHTNIGPADSPGRSCELEWRRVSQQ